MMPKVRLNWILIVVKLTVSLNWNRTDTRWLCRCGWCHRITEALKVYLRFEVWHETPSSNRFDDNVSGLQKMICFSFFFACYFCYFYFDVTGLSGYLLYRLIFFQHIKIPKSTKTPVITLSEFQSKALYYSTYLSIFHLVFFPIFEVTRMSVNRIQNEIQQLTVQSHSVIRCCGSCLLAFEM